SVFFLAVLKLDYGSLYLAMLLGLIGQLLLLERKLALRHHVSWRCSCPQEIRAMLVFALPLCFNSLGYWFLTDYNRTVIFHKLSPEANGLFSLAGKFPLALLLVSLCFQLAWQETAFAKRDASGTFYSKAGGFFLLSLFCCGSLWLSFVALVFPVLVDSAYAAARSLIPLYMTAILASIYNGFLGTIFTALKATKFLFLSTLCACIVNVVLLQTLLDSLGVIVAPLALASGYLTSSFLRFWRLKRTIRYGDWQRSSLAALALFGLSAYVFLQGTYEASGCVLLGQLALFFCLFRRKVFGLLAKVREVTYGNLQNYK
ncbi:MAG: polysaccharide biosynthesis C-terminal domain-containing protein, partial [Sporomusaceae bacterium]|nr:polysaccharide biosynthesis C-terminal domain-containing protein [Sporomusaceae bacterium]